MAKEITRTVRVYRHTFGKLKKGENGFEVEDMVEVTQATKMGNKLAAQYIASHELAKGTKLIAVEAVEEKYAMPVEKFMEMATKIL